MGAYVCMHCMCKKIIVGKRLKRGAKEIIHVRLCVTVIHACMHAYLQKWRAAASAGRSTHNRIAAFMFVFVESSFLKKNKE